MKILQVAAFGAKQPGSFIRSMERLEFKLNKLGYQTIYAFSETAKGSSWCKEIEKRTKVYYLPVAKARVLPKTYKIFAKIYRENNIDITHTHFELYDIPATLTCNKNTKVYWHLHDAIGRDQKYSRVILNRLQYGIFSKRARLISVSEYYRKKVVKWGFNSQDTTTVLNGIDVFEIKKTTSSKKEYDFLTYGWDFEGKGIDIILDSLTKINNNGYFKKILIVGTKNTEEKVKSFFKNEIPKWISLTGPVKDINTLFDKSAIFISASRAETFSYAICEAAYAGLKVYSSNIHGVEWATKLPTVTFFENNSKELHDLIIKNDLQVLTFEDYFRTRVIIEEEFSTDRWVKDIISQYFID